MEKLDLALAEAAETLATKAAESDVSINAERFAHSAAMLAHAAKGTPGGGVVAATPSS